MNEQIRELYKEAIGKEWAYDFDEHYAEKFAELILFECVKLAVFRGDTDTARAIKKHFGVEE